MRPPVRQTSRTFRQEIPTADGRPKRQIRPPPDRDIPMYISRRDASELRFCLTILKELQKKVYEPHSHPFLRRLDDVTLNKPDYSKVIKYPMDFGTVGKKLNEQKYLNANECYNDIKLIFKNCYKYIGVDKPVRGIVKQLEKVFDEKWHEKSKKLTRKPAGKREPASSSTRRRQSSSFEDEIGTIQEQMTTMAKRLNEIRSRKKKRLGYSTSLQMKDAKGKTVQRKGSRISKESNEIIVDLTLDQKVELVAKLNLLSPSKIEGVCRIINDVMSLDVV